MVAVASPDDVWITVTEAAALAGCVEGYLRRLLADGRIRGWKAGERAWLVDRKAVLELAGQLSTRSNRRKAERKTLKKPAKAAKRRRRG
jgi:excisionase family DNA binding protein